MQTDTDLLRDWEEAKEKTRIFAMQRVSSVTDLADWDKVQSEIYAAQVKDIPRFYVTVMTNDILVSVDRSRDETKQKRHSAFGHQYTGVRDVARTIE